MKITKPTFLIHKEKCVENIQFIIEKTKKHLLSFRPHFKTHQSEIVSQWFRELGVSKIAVSSVDMAMFFIERQWKDITIAFPFNLLQTKTINSIGNDVQLNLLVDSIETVLYLKNNLERETGIFIEIDIDYGRSGILYSEIELITKISHLILESKRLKFKGFLIHSGNTYSAISKKEVLEIHAKNITILKKLKENFIDEFPNLMISYGDTPTASIANDFEGIDELRPGNFIYYDLMQTKIGSCSSQQISAFILAPVVGIKKEKFEIILYAGAVHLSKEFLNFKGEKNFGQVYSFMQKNNKVDYKGFNYIYSLSQEHGLVKCNEEFISNIKIGDLVAILPIHSCLTANLMKYSTVVLE